MRETLKKYGGEIYRGLLSLLVLFIAIYTRGETERIAPFAFALILLLCLGLAILPRTRYLNLLFLHLTLLFIFCYDSAAVFVKFVWLAPLAVVALVVHLIRLRPRLRIGPSFLPLAAVAVATVLGGVGMITAEEYFSPAALGYVAGLGPGLVLTYLLMKNEGRDAEDEKALQDDLFWWGVTAAAVVFVYVLPELLQTQAWPSLQWNNNISTMLMIAMPAVVARIKRNPAFWLAALAIPLAMALSGSRSGFLFSFIEFLICIIWLFFSEKRMKQRIVNISVLLVIAAVIYFWLWPAFRSVKDIGAFMNLGNPDEVRWKLLKRGWENFLENPLFGSGLGYLGNADLYNGKTGTINWYHIFPAQVLGGLGLFGALTWGWQLVTRALLAWRVRKSDTFVLALCYLGLLMMSMVNPGEFCPAPYAFLAVYFFALIENRTEGIGERQWFLPLFKARKE